MTKKKQKETLFAIDEDAFISYFFTVDMGRKISRNIITDILTGDEKAEDEFALVCEYYSALYHMESVLEQVEAEASFDEKKFQYMEGQKLGMRLIVYINSLFSIQSELVQKYNLSLALH